jgi:hypothetical protein
MVTMKPIPERLRELTELMRASISNKEGSSDFELVDRLQESAEAAQKAWSGSSIGYHARVYYSGFKQPPRGANFSSEWGLSYKPSNYSGASGSRTRGGQRSSPVVKRPTGWSSWMMTFCPAHPVTVPARPCR